MAASHRPALVSEPAPLAMLDAATQRARAILVEHGAPPPELRFAGSPPESGEDSLATCLMDVFRASHDSEVFDALVQLVRDVLLRRVRGRLRFLGAHLDPDEVLQDVLVNIYRYPDRFDASRPGAFRAWSSMIVDNSIRRQLRKRRTGPEIILQTVEDLSRERDPRVCEPSERAERREDCREANATVGLLLAAYLRAYQELNERERFVLQMVEVNGLRYAQVAEALGVRPEALKMVVFRARRRIHDKLTVMFARAGVVSDEAA